MRNKKILLVLGIILLSIIGVYLVINKTTLVKEHFSEAVEVVDKYTYDLHKSSYYIVGHGERSDNTITISVSKSLYDELNVGDVKYMDYTIYKYKKASASVKINFLY